MATRSSEIQPTEGTDVTKSISRSLNPLAQDLSEGKYMGPGRSDLVSPPARDGRVRYNFWTFAVHGLMPCREERLFLPYPRPLDGMKADQAPSLHLFLAPLPKRLRVLPSHVHTFRTIQYRPAHVAFLPTAVTSAASSVSIEPCCLGVAKGNAPGPKRGCSRIFD
jgi:hypothetical protein